MAQVSSIADEQTSTPLSSSKSITLRISRYNPAHDNLLKVDGVDDVKVNVSNHFMAEQINNQVNNSPNPKKLG